MKYNYPVKYAIMPIYEQVGWMSGLHELERSYEVVGNIVSKCYVVSKKISYLEDGSEEKEFEVVFPYRKTDYRRTYDWERVYPEFSFGRNCINSNIVRELYDNFDDAKEVVEKLNGDILSYNLGVISFRDKERRENIKKEHEERMTRFKYLERKIEEETISMKANNKPKEQSIIVMFNDDDKILPMSIYSFINLYRNEAFYACNVSSEEYEKMMSQIKKNGFLSERYYTIDYSYDKSRYLLFNDKEHGTIRILDCDSENIDGSYYLKNGILCYSSDDMCSLDKDIEFIRSLHGIKVYTTERYEDIINSYRTFSDINNNITQNSDLSKRLVKSR